MTLRTRVTLLTVALLMASLTLIGAVVYGLLQGFLYRNLRSEIQASTQQVIRLIGERVQVVDILKLALPANVYSQIDYGFIRTGKLTLPDLLQAVEVVKGPLLQPNQRLVLPKRAYEELLSKGETWTTLSLPLEQGGRISLLVNAVLLQGSGGDFVISTVGRPTASIDFTLDQLARIYTATALIVLMLGAWLAYRLMSRTLEPLEWVAKRAEGMSERPTKLPELEGNNEVAALVRALNGMLARLEEAWETQTRFLADASHELRTPVTAILGHVSYLLRRTPLTEQQKESLEIVRREGERMKKLVGDLLELSKTGGTWRVELSPVHLHTLLAEIAEDYGQSFPQGGRIRLEVPEDLWVLGDVERLHQVFANMVSNAQKAQASEIRLVARDLQERVVIRVEDNGEGIPPEHLPHLFERFYRVDKARDRERGGSGLGLSIVKAIVEAHGGSVWVESEVGRGSTFSVSLRRAEALVSAKP
jgi:signal transduction histidine kinase